MKRLTLFLNLILCLSVITSNSFAMRSTQLSKNPQFKSMQLELLKKIEKSVHDTRKFIQSFSKRPKPVYIPHVFKPLVPKTKVASSFRVLRRNIRPVVNKKIGRLLKPKKITHLLIQKKLFPSSGKEDDNDGTSNTVTYLDNGAKENENDTLNRFWSVKKGYLRNAEISAPNNDGIVYFKAKLYDSNKQLLAFLVSKTIKLTKFNNKFVEIGGFTKGLHIMIFPYYPTIDVRKIKVLDPPNIWVIRKGFLKNARAIIPLPLDNDSTTPLPVAHYFGDLFDIHHKLIAKLESTTVHLTSYNNKYVEVGGTLLPSPIITPSIMPHPIRMNVERIKILIPPPPPIIELRGQLVIIKYNDSIVPDNDGTPDNNGAPITIHPSNPKAKLLDNEGKIIAFLISKTIRLERYDGLLVHISGIRLPRSIPKQLSAGAIIRVKPIRLPLAVPLINVLKIKIINDEPPIEVWRGIIMPATKLPEIHSLGFLFILKNKEGFVGILDSDNKAMLEKLKSKSEHFVVAVSGSVRKIIINNRQVKVMDVKRCTVLYYLRNVIWMNEKPLFFRIGEEINFDKIGGIIWPPVIDEKSISALDNDSVDSDNDTADSDNDSTDSDNDTSIRRIFYQIAWDFDTSVQPLKHSRSFPIPIELDNSSELDNGTSGDRVEELDNSASELLSKWHGNVIYANYDYTEDSRIITILPQTPIHVYRKPGLYRVTLTGEYITERGFVKKIQSASRIIVVLPRKSHSLPVPIQLQGEVDND